MMRDKIAAMALEAINGVHEDSGNRAEHAERFTDAILAALPGMMPDLVWVECNGQPWRHTAKGIGGEYVLTDWAVRDLHLVPSGANGFWVMGIERAGHVEFSDKKSSKSAANAHNRAAIAQAAGWTP